MLKMVAMYVALAASCAAAYDRDPDDKIFYRIVVEWKEEMVSRFDTVVCRSYHDLGGRVYVALEDGSDIYPDRVVRRLDVIKREDKAKK